MRSYAIGGMFSWLIFYHLRVQRYTFLSKYARGVGSLMVCDGRLGLAMYRAGDGIALLRNDTDKHIIAV